MKKRSFSVLSLLLAALMLLSTACGQAPTDDNQGDGPTPGGELPAPGVAGSYLAALNDGNYALAYESLLAKDPEVKDVEAELGKFIAVPVSFEAIGDFHYGDYTATFTYDDKGQLTKVTFPHKNSTDIYTFTYDDDGRLLSQTEEDDDGDPTRGYFYTYDENGRLTTYRQTSYGEDILVTTYTYSDDGKTATEKEVRTQYGETKGKTYTAVYDDKGRLLTRKNADGEIVCAYTYDDKGNILTETETDLSSGTNTYTYDDQNRLIKDRWDDMESDYWSERVYAYDVNGTRMTISYEGTDIPISEYAYTHEKDADGRVTKEIYVENNEDGDHKETTFDEKGNKIGIVWKDAESGREEKYTFGYDALRNRTYEKYEQSDGKSYEYKVVYEVKYFEDGAPEMAEFLRGLNEEDTLRYFF